MVKKGIGPTSDASTQLTGPKLREKNMLVINIIAIPALNIIGSALDYLRAGKNVITVVL